MQAHVHKKQKAEKREPLAMRSLGNQLQDALKPLLDAQKEAKIEQKAKERKAIDEQKARELKAIDEAKNAGIYAYADEIKKRHPQLPEDLHHKIRTSATVGDAKRILKEHLASHS